MANEETSASALDVQELFADLEVPFPPDQVRWRVTNTTTDKKRGQIVPYADPRAYADRLNALFTPQGWTREYKVQTMTNITRVKRGESIASGTSASPSRTNEISITFRLRFNVEALEWARFSCLARSCESTSMACRVRPTASIIPACTRSCVSRPALRPPSFASLSSCVI